MTQTEYSALGDVSDSGTPETPEHPRTIGWLGTTALALGGSNQSLVMVGVLIVG